MTSLEIYALLCIRYDLKQQFQTKDQLMVHVEPLLFFRGSPVLVVQQGVVVGIDHQLAVLVLVQELEMVTDLSCVEFPTDEVIETGQQ
jgi:hypothetical protein